MNLLQAMFWLGLSLLNFNLEGGGMMREDFTSVEEKLVGKILNTSTLLIEKKHKIRGSGAGSAMPGGVIKEFTLAFDIVGPITKENLREILLSSAHIVQEQVTSDQEIQQYLEKHPFSINKVQIILYVHAKGGYDLYDPDIAVGKISGGTLCYQTVDAADTFGYKSTFEETYEEAVKSAASPSS